MRSSDLKFSRSEFLFFALTLLLGSSCLMTPASAHADGAAFDLVGPKVDVRVERAGVTLPIGEVPNLQGGDRLWVHPDLPDSQSVHYLLVVAFLRGSTNPPPDSWFTRAETWSKAVHEEGIYVNVPQEAEQALIFLAPETGGAFSTLRTAVRGKPGAFVRAAQDLEQASFDRERLEAYLSAVREMSANDLEDLKSRTTLLARSLNIKLDQQCFDKPSAQQVPCLTQNTDQLVLDDEHSQTMVATLTTGAPTDLLSQISATPRAGGGYYSPYIGAVVDVVRILGTAHTAQYQYIPALALPNKDELNLRLNNPPSFRNPKSVIVIGLPPIRPAIAPPLRAVDPKEIYCADKPDLVLPVEGAPLVFATALAHHVVLHVDTKPGTGFDLPVTADSGRGGYVIETKDAPRSGWAGEVSGVIRGSWGFQSFEGPRFRLRASRPGQWIVASKDASALIVGREDTLHLQSADACCVSGVVLKAEDGKTLFAEWKVPKAGELEVKVPLKNATPGPVKMLVNKFGLGEPDEVMLHTYAEAGRLDSFSIHAGDSEGLLKGTRLDEVKALEIKGVVFSPENLSRADQVDELKVVTHDSTAATALDAGMPQVAQVTLMDGRTLSLDTVVEAPRPRLTLLSKSVQLEDATPLIRLGNPDELPQDARLNFFLKSPDAFAPSEKVEVATADESFRVLLSMKDGNLTLQDAKTVYAVLDPMKLLGPSAFGPLKFRPVSGDVEGDWQPLVNLVRMPELKGIQCPPENPEKPKAAEKRATTKEAEKARAEKSDPAVALAKLPVADASDPAVKPSVAGDSDASEKLPASSDKTCMLSGDKLFLIDAVSADPTFANSITVPDGFVNAVLAVPAPKDKALYIKLRDDPATVDTAVLPELTPQP